MASFIKRGKSWLAQINKAGVRKASTFSTKTEAIAWAAQEEADIIAGKRGDIPNKTFGDMLIRYRDEVSPTKKGERWERIRINLLLQDEISSKRLSELDERDISDWRDRRLKDVSAGSVRREWNLLSSACSIAMKEWKWLKHHPMENVRRPPEPKSRERVATYSELERIAVCLGYLPNKEPRSVGARVAVAMYFAVETGMRQGEISGLLWSDVFIARRFLTVREGKTDAASRDVPLSPEALRLLNSLPIKNSESVFSLSTTQIDANFRKAKKLAGVDGLTFHDLRHTAITRLAKKIDVLPLARMVGHRDLKMLLRYYNPSAEDLASKLT